MSEPQLFPPEIPLRVLFDENMSGKVARALKLLDKDVVRSPPARNGKKGRPDSLVARSAKRSKRFVFTNNYDMVVAAVDEGARIIWFYDRKQNSPTRYNTARLFFQKWEYWEQRLSPPDAYCLRVSMDRTTLITKEAARRQASSLDKKQKSKKKAIVDKVKQGKLAFDD